MDPSASPPDADVDTADDALMAQMGFASFGAASPPSKRRRYNPHADAALPPRPAPSSATGANSTALGSNAAEIPLDDDDNNDSEVVLPPAQARLASLPQRPAPSQASRQGQNSAPHGNRDTWYVGYYDPMSNENPWERLEKARGLEARGTWISRGAGRPAATTGTAA
ncbi:hypothetical protein FZEAL_6294 [Fusarium zealandicum]|uniref:Uncharacterized protein n=1 Tax=Fusarium zealandicum TaxID=1053134 RepID=A0A8H4UIV2_9HYPO|nr:hypothetical protein FZEAL_6294 [Fusarium zealandicum]